MSDWKGKLKRRRTCMTLYSVAGLLCCQTWNNYFVVVLEWWLCVNVDGGGGGCGGEGGGRRESRCRLFMYFLRLDTIFIVNLIWTVFALGYLVLVLACRYLGSVIRLRVCIYLARGVMYMNIVFCTTLRVWYVNWLRLCLRLNVFMCLLLSEETKQFVIWHYYVSYFAGLRACHLCYHIVCNIVVYC